MKNPMGLNANPTYFGTCAAKTTAGKPCAHKVIFANGLCAQHGGATPADYQKRILERSQEKFERQKRRLQTRIEKTTKRLMKCQDHRSAPSGPTAASARAKTSTANPAAAGRSASRDQASCAVNITEAAANKLAQEQKPENSAHGRTSPGQSLKPVERAPIAISYSPPSETRSDESKVDSGRGGGAPVASARTVDCVPIPPVMDWRVVPGQAYVARCRAQIVAELKMRRDPYTVTSPERGLVEPPGYKD